MNGPVFVATIAGICGNGVVEANEECDDGNTVDGDGCSSTCNIEEGVIPTVSLWGLMVIILLLLTTGKILFGCRRNATE